VAFTCCPQPVHWRGLESKQDREVLPPATIDDGVRGAANTFGSVVREEHDMRYRVIGLPAPYAVAAEVVVVDRRGTFCLLNPEQFQLTELPPSEARAIMGFFEPAEHAGWWSLDELARKLRLRPARDTTRGDTTPETPSDEPSNAYHSGHSGPASNSDERAPASLDYQRGARRMRSSTLQALPSPYSPSTAGFPTRRSSVHAAGYPSRRSPLHVRQWFSRRHARDPDPLA
jgi:hypothetical protein